VNTETASTVDRLLGELKARKDLLDFSTLPPLLDVGTVAAVCDCSPRHIYRLSDSDRMPRPIRLGSLVRWRKDDIKAWIDAGCPSTRKGGRP
jgi:predicted DNA-binding transcriptional regulator AlpA